MRKNNRRGAARSLPAPSNGRSSATSGGRRADNVESYFTRRPIGDWPDMQWEDGNAEALPAAPRSRAR
jgi:hypothetical protein